MNSRYATKPLRGTLFDTRDIVRDKLAENIPEKPYLFVLATVLKSISHVNEKIVGRVRNMCKDFYF
ncbi:hypothetical protein AB4K20DRAFT_1950940 [Rhizopus microsporus]